MHILPPLDVAALAFFLLAWGGYAIAVEWGPGSNTGLNSRMHAYRDIWMRRALHRVQLARRQQHVCQTRVQRQTRHVASERSQPPCRIESIQALP